MSQRHRLKIIAFCNLPKMFEGSSWKSLEKARSNSSQICLFEPIFTSTKLNRIENCTMLKHSNRPIYKKIFITIVFKHFIGANNAFPVNMKIDHNSAESLYQPQPLRL